MRDLVPAPINDVASDHHLHGVDARRLPESALATAAGLAILPALERYRSYLRIDLSRTRHLAEFASSVPRRIERVLIARRRSFELTDRAPTLDALDDLRDDVTLAFVHLMGAFDVLAIVASDAVGLDLKFPQIGWQKKDFLQALRRSAPDLVRLIEPESPGSRNFQIVKEIRNTIHRRMPDIGTSGRAQGDPALARGILLFERTFHPEILESLEKTDWMTYSGIQSLGADRVTIRPEELLLMAVNRCIPLFNSLMDATPLEHLGPPQALMPPEQSLFPESMRRYAVEHFGVAHLSPHITQT